MLDFFFILEIDEYLNIIIFLPYIVMFWRWNLFLLFLFFINTRYQVFLFFRNNNNAFSDHVKPIEVSISLSSSTVATHSHM